MVNGTVLHAHREATQTLLHVVPQEEAIVLRVTP